MDNRYVLPVQKKETAPNAMHGAVQISWRPHQLWVIINGL